MAVQIRKKIGRAKLLAVDRYRDPFFEADRHLNGLVGGVVRIDRPRPDGVARRVDRILQFAALMGEMPEIAVAAIDLGFCGINRNVVRLGVVDGVLAGLDVPDSPRSDDLQMGCEGLVGQLEADLVVAFSGAAVAEGVTAVSSATSTCRFANRGRAIEVPSRYLSS